MASLSQGQASPDRDKPGSNARAESFEGLPALTKVPPVVNREVRGDRQVELCW